ncbi:MAG: N-acetylmuramoyl-L-alanine amidase family protein [Longimicrobiales bacterium]
MKLAGCVFALGLVLSTLGFSARARSQFLRPSDPSLVPAVAPEQDRAPGVFFDSVPRGVPREIRNEGVEVVEPPQERVRRPDSTRRSSRRWRRNRYPGPIPTPEEWKPPEGPVRIALQAGHWKADEAPPELSGLRDNGTRWEGKPEWEANVEIAQRAGALLEELGYEVDILPAVVPPGYRAHLFISIHADGSTDPKMSGYRVSAPRRDATGRASGFADLLQESYGEKTGLTRIPTVTHRMQNYYAFNFRRYEHALHPMTIGVILETGFLTSPVDRGVIIDDPERAARGIVEAVKAFPETPPSTSRPPAKRDPEKADVSG